jgi:hypothetical protein
MNDNFRRSIGELIVDGDRLGTAWIIHKNLAVTAYHCIAAAESTSEITIRFSNRTFTCTVEDKIEKLDFATLRFVGEDLPSLQILTRPIGAVSGAEWYGHGYPSGLNVYASENEGMSLNGNIDNLFAEINNVSSMQLSCNQSANIRPVPGSVLGGVSGSPVLVSFQDASFVIGFIREHPPQFGESVLFATALDQIDFQSLVNPISPVLHSWDEYRGIPTVRDIGGGNFQANINLPLIRRVWEEGLSGFWCNIQPDECEVLANSIERILVHSKPVGTRSRVKTNMRGAKGWEATCKKYIRDWIPLSNFSHQDPLQHLHFAEIDIHEVTRGGEVFMSARELAEHIQHVCNCWVLERLRERLSVVFSDPEGRLDFAIAPDILAEMKKLWIQWLRELSSDRCLLHHFLGLMQTGDGNFDMQESGAGVGPLTLDRCVAGPIAYTLALCTALPDSLQSPKATRPGNVGISGLEGHACGIELLKGRTLNSVGRTHQWRTAVVMLPFLQGEWRSFDDAHQRLNVAISDRSQSLAKEPPGPVVLPKDSELQLAIQSGLLQLRKILEFRCQQLDQEQNHYVDRASDVQR